MSKEYKYTVLRQDGRIQELRGSHKRDFGELYTILHCDTIEIIPDTYYPDDWGECTVYGDENGRFHEENHTNPHMKVLTDYRNHRYDCVGDLVKEEVING